MARVTESQLREALRSYLATRAAKSVARIVEELGVERGAARIDFAVITDRLLGFEIKSDLDSFDRLSNQIHAYNRVFDEITLVSGPALAEDALRILPSWWGVMVAEWKVDGIALNIVRTARKNPIQEPLSVAMLLWKTEAMDALAAQTGRNVPSRWVSAKVHAMLAEVLSLDSLRRLVVSKLNERAIWRSRAQLEQDDDLLHHVAMSKDFLT